jgi:hypothetical protein
VVEGVPIVVVTGMEEVEVEVEVVVEVEEEEDGSMIGDEADLGPDRGLHLPEDDLDRRCVEVVAADEAHLAVAVVAAPVVVVVVVVVDEGHGSEIRTVPGVGMVIGKGVRKPG